MNIFSADFMPDNDLKFLMDSSYKGFSSAMGFPGRYEDRLTFEMDSVVLLWKKSEELFNRMKWLLERLHGKINSAMPWELREILDSMFIVKTDENDKGGKKYIKEVLTIWQNMERNIINTEPFEQAKMIDEQLGIADYVRHDFGEVNVFLVEAMKNEAEYIWHLLSEVEKQLGGTRRKISLEANGEMILDGVKHNFAKPNSVQFLVLRKIIGSKARCVKNSVLNGAISDFLEKKNESDKIMDAEKRKSLYSARNDINKKFRNLFSVDFDLIEMKGGYCYLAEKLEAVKVQKCLCKNSGRVRITSEKVKCD